MQSKNLFRLVLVGVLLIAIFLFFKYDISQYLTLDALKAQQAKISALNDNAPIKTGLIFFIIYVLVTALSLPGAAILTLAAGAFFGLFKGLLLASFASTLGATLAFLMARFLLQDTVEKKFSQYTKKINDGVDNDGAFYLFGMRLVPAIPFFVINLVMGLTRMKAKTFAWVSQLGMLPGTFVFVNAGQQLASIESLGDIASPKLILSFVLLAIFPFIAKKALAHLKKAKQA